MANIVPDSFKTGLLKGTFNFDTAGNSGNAFKLALYTSISSYSASSTTYLAGTGNGEVSSTGTAYPAGGKALTNNGVAVSSNIAFIDFAELTIHAPIESTSQEQLSSIANRLFRTSFCSSLKFCNRSTGTSSIILIRISSGKWLELIQVRILDNRSIRIDDGGFSSSIPRLFQTIWSFDLV